MLADQHKGLRMNKTLLHIRCALKWCAAQRACANPVAWRPERL